jgi:hypothetical protein
MSVKVQARRVSRRTHVIGPRTFFQELFRGGRGNRVAVHFGAFITQIAALEPFSGHRGGSRRKLDVSYLPYGRT